jgi:cytochrome P450
MPWIDPRAPTCPVDTTTEAFAEHPVSGYSEIRRHGPIVWQQQNRAFLLTRYADTFAVLRDPRFFSPDLMTAWRHVQNKVGRDYSDHLELSSFMPFVLEGDRHTWMRRSFAMGIAPFANGTPAMRTRISGMLAGFRKNGGFDLAADFAGRLLFEIMCDLLDMPDSERPRLEPFAKLSWTLEAALSVRDRDVASGIMREGRAALADHVRQRLNDKPAQLVGTIADSLPEHVDDKAHAVASIGAVMLLMGNDAIGSCISMAVRQLKEVQPLVPKAEWEGLADDAIRFTAPVDFLNRIALEDMMLCGCPIREGDRIILSPLCANHDAAEFGEETEMISIKPGKNVGLTFGAGSHLCVGNRFSRTLVRMALAELAALPDFRLAGPAKQRRGKVVRTLESLPVEFV